MLGIFSARVILLRMYNPTLMWLEPLGSYGERLAYAWRTLQAMAPVYCPPRLLRAVTLGVGVLVVAFLLIQGLQTFKPQDLPDLTLPVLSTTDTSAKRSVPELDLQAVAQSNWFGTAAQTALVEEDLTANTTATTLNVVLQGTLLGKIPRAVIYNNETRESKILKTGESIVPGSVVEKITRRKVVISNNGKLEHLSLPTNMYDEMFEDVTAITAATPSPIALPTTSQPYVLLFNRPVQHVQKTSLKRPDIIKALANLGKLSEEAKFINRVAGSVKEGFRITELKNNGFLRKLSLKEGDILLKVDDVRVTDREKLFPLLMGLSTARNAKITFARDDEVYQLTVWVE